MKLSYKHMAIFGRVTVDIQNLDGHFYKTATLLELYKDGWFVTERFGSIISICKGNARDGFSNRFRLFRTDVNLDTFDLLWKPLADQQFEKYHDYLLNNTHKPYTKIKKVNINEN